MLGRAKHRQPGRWVPGFNAAQPHQRGQTGILKRGLRSKAWERGLPEGRQGAGARADATPQRLGWEDVPPKTRVPRQPFRSPPRGTRDAQSPNTPPRAAAHSRWQEPAAATDPTPLAGVCGRSAPSGRKPNRWTVPLARSQKALIGGSLDEQRFSLVRP